MRIYPIPAGNVDDSGCGGGSHVYATSFYSRPSSKRAVTWLISARAYLTQLLTWVFLIMIETFSLIFWLLRQLLCDLWH